MVRQITVIALLFSAAGCDSGRHSSSGFRLPVDGDAVRGKVAFVDLGCASCHEVAGVALPKPTVVPPVPVVLGGDVVREVTDGYLVTSIINPSDRLAHWPAELISVNGKSRMPTCADRMTARQLTDIVAFLQSRYTLRPAALRYPYS